MEAYRAWLAGELEAIVARAVLATADIVVGTDAQRRAAAERAGARVAVLEGLDHWWLAQDPERAARVLVDFWASV